MILVCFSLIVLMSESASAYLDTGSASMIVQLAVGAVVGAFVFLKMNWLKLSAFTKRLVRKR